MTQIRKGSVLLVGTSKGVFIFRSDARRKKWTFEGPLSFAPFNEPWRVEMRSHANPLPFHTSRANEALHGSFQRMMRQPPGGVHGAEV